MKKWQKIFIAIYAVASIVGLLLTTAKASANHSQSVSVEYKLLGSQIDAKPLSLLPKKYCGG